MALFLNVTLDLFKRVGGVQAVRTIFEIARPVFQFVFRRPGQQRRDNRACHQRTEEPDKSPLVHGSTPSTIDIGHRNFLFLSFETRQLYTYFLSFQRAPMRLVELERATRATLETYLRWVPDKLVFAAEVSVPCYRSRLLSRGPRFRAS